MDEYINPEDATRLRVFHDGTWFIDAADDDGNYTEVCWDSKVVEEAGKRRWHYIESLEDALELAQDFARVNAPHLVGTNPKVRYDDLMHHETDQKEML